MCEYCDGERKPIISIAEMRKHFDASSVCGFDEDGKLRISTLVQTADFITNPPIAKAENVKYCPMCGRKLQ